MKPSIKTLITFLLAVPVFLSGCIKETLPIGGTVTDGQINASDEPLSVKVGALSAQLSTVNAAGFYSNYGIHCDFGLPSIHIMTECMLEDMTVCGISDYNQYGAYTSNQAMGYLYIWCGYFWYAYYKWIGSANEVIRSVKNLQSLSDDDTHALGQAYAYRAMFYLDLARLYEPKQNLYAPVPEKIQGLTVPIVDENTTEKDAIDNPRAPRKDLYDFILSDLEKAEEYLRGSGTAFNAPTVAAVYGLRARAYLEMAYWDATQQEKDFQREAFSLAYKWAEKAISESGKSCLSQDEWEDPSRGFNSGSSNNSWIWGLPLVSENVNNVSSFLSFMSTESRWSYGVLLQFGASRSFYEKISESDFRKHSWLDPQMRNYYNYRLAGTSEQQAEFYSGGSLVPAQSYANIKFRPGQGEVQDYVVGAVGDHPVMRVEEMYFIMMEAAAGMNNYTEARKLLNSFMAKRITDGSYNCDLTATTPASFRKEMLFQKRVEFWGEGILIFDYKRLDQGITRGYDGTNFASGERLNTNGRSPQWNIVIPRNELQNNRGISQETNNPDPEKTIPLWQ